MSAGGKNVIRKPCHSGPEEGCSARGGFDERVRRRRKEDDPWREKERQGREGEFRRRMPQDGFSSKEIVRSQVEKRTVFYTQAEGGFAVATRKSPIQFHYSGRQETFFRGN